MKFLRTIRFDASDDHVFEHAAPADEWAVSGAFAFGNEAATLAGKPRQAFVSAFLGIGSFGRCTFASVSNATTSDVESLETDLARYFVTTYGAPDESAARPAAAEEIQFIIDLCRDAPINTVFSVKREIDDGGHIRETFFTIEKTRAPDHAKIWTILDDGT